ncbi:MAG: AcrR family transcriptional regulator, partial [Gammaproteobacteria bacterium]
MRTTQRTALSMFIERGFDDVTVGEIAAEVGMAPSTLYRHFRTKEDIVMWDEHDAAIDVALDRALAGRPPLEALRMVFVDELATRYDVDLDFQLRRIRYIYATKQLHAAAVEADLRTRAELATGLEQTMTKPNRPAAAIIAAAASLLALDIAIDRWQADNAKQSLAKRIEESFPAARANQPAGLKPSPRHACHGSSRTALPVRH